MAAFRALLMAATVFLTAISPLFLRTAVGPADDTAFAVLRQRNRALRASANAVSGTAGNGNAGGAAPRAIGEPLATYEACVVRRNPSSALMRLGDGTFFELDLRPIPDTPFALAPDDCVTVEGLYRDNQPGLRREFPEGAFVLEGRDIRDAPSHEPPTEPEQDGDSGSDDSGE